MRTWNKALTLAALAVLALASDLRAAPPAPTTITVSDMHCMACAKKMAAKLYEVPGVGAVNASVQTATLTITAKESQSPSPRALWEAIEQAGYKPAKLEGPGGTYTAKPQS